MFLKSKKNVDCSSRASNKDIRLVVNYFSILLVFIISGCSNDVDPYQKAYENVELVNTKCLIELDKIKIDTVVVDKVLSISGEGFWKKKDNFFYYFDKLLGTVDCYDIDGHFIKRAMGIGKGPGEVLEEIGTICRFKEGWLLAHVYHLSLFSETLDSKETKYLFKFDADFENKKKSIMKDPHPSEDIEVYVPAYDYPQMIFNKEESVLLKVSCEYPDYNEKLYYKESTLIANYDFSKGTITKLMGRYSPVYQKTIKYPAFAHHYFSKYEHDKYLLNFGIDSLIYVCDENFIPQKAFGRKAKFVDCNYVQKNKFEWKDIEKERSEKGYYVSIFYCKEKDVVFRVYKTGLKDNGIKEGGNPTRMQIYKGKALIGDVSVPDNFEIIAYDAPYFYCDGYTEIGEDYDKIGIYRFKL